MCRGTPAPRRNLCAGDEHKPKESTFKKKTLWSLHTIPYLALNDGILSPVHGLQADTAQCRFGRGGAGVEVAFVCITHRLTLGDGS